MNYVQCYLLDPLIPSPNLSIIPEPTLNIGYVCINFTILGINDNIVPTYYNTIIL